MKRIEITNRIWIQDHEIQWEAVRAQGPGGQHVNKVATAVQLRFDIRASGLSDDIKTALMNLKDRRITKDGVIVLKAQRYRSQHLNRTDALDRLKILIEKAALKPVKRKPTRPSRRSAAKRMDSKTRRGRIKQLRGKVTKESF